jgi:peptidyl-prolyl cis-trans isomerase SurA
MVIVALASSPAQAQWFDRIAARVDEDVITLHDVRLAAPPFLLQRGMNPDMLRDVKQREKVYGEVLSDLIDQRLILKEAGKMEQRVTDEEVEKWLAYTRQQQRMSEAQFNVMLERFGMDRAEYRETVRNQILRMRVMQIKVGGKVSVSDAEVEQVYRERYGDEALTIDYYTIRHVLVQPSANDDAASVEGARRRAQRALDRIARGEDFKRVAEEESDGPSAREQGLLGTYRRGELDPEFEAAVFSLRLGEVSNVVRTRFGFHVITIDQIEKRPNPEVEERKNVLRGELQAKAGERLSRSYMQNLRARSYIKVF